jgi:hypothetical protein
VRKPIPRFSLLEKLNRNFLSANQQEILHVPYPLSQYLGRTTAFSHSAQADPQLSLLEKINKQLRSKNLKQIRGIAFQHSVVSRPHASHCLKGLIIKFCQCEKSNIQFHFNTIRIQVVKRAFQHSGEADPTLLIARKA